MTANLDDYYHAKGVYAMQLSDAQNIVFHLFHSLCDGSKVDFSDTTCNWEEILELMRAQKLFVPGYKLIREALPLTIKEKYDKEHAQYIMKNSIYLKEIDRLIRISHKKKVFPLVMKGIALSYYIHGNVEERQFNDIDFIIAEDDMIRLNSILREEGYDQIFVDLLTGFKCTLQTPLLRSTWSHEYYSYKRSIGAFEIKAEIGKQLHSTVTGEKMLQFLENTTVLSIAGCTIPTFDLNHTLLELLENMYANAKDFTIPGYMRLSDYLDLYLFLEKYDYSLDYEEIKELIQKYDMSEAVNSVINDACHLFSTKSGAVILGAARKLNIGISPKQSISTLDRIFNNKSSATTAHYKKLSAEIFSELNPNYLVPITKPINNCAFQMVSNDDTAFNIGISYHMSGLHLSVNSGWDTSKYRIRFLIYNNDFSCRLNEITLREDHSDLLMIVKNMNYVEHIDVEPDMQTVVIKQQDFNETSGISENSFWATIDYSMLRWDQKLRPNMLGIGLLIEKRFDDLVFQRFYNIAPSPTPLICKGFSEINSSVG